MADAKLSSVRSSFFLMKSSCEADTHCLFQIMNGNICLIVLIYGLKKSLFFSKYHKCHITHITDAVYCSFHCCFLVFHAFRKKHIPGTFSSLTDSIHKFHSLILQFRCKKYSAFSLFSLRLYFDKRVLRTRSATFFCQILLFLVYFSFIFFFYIFLLYRII